MKKAFLLCILISLITLQVKAQDTALVRQRASVLAQAMLKSDYSTIIDNTYPKAIQLAGGKEKMIEYINKFAGQMKEIGMSFDEISMGTPGKFYRTGNEIYCLVPENITFKTQQGRILSHSSLLGISQDNGKSWTFLDINNSSRANLKLIIPNINPGLEIPKATTEQVP
jgi:hypothetical protein